ncbi:site-specific DNA-methyltransferase [Methylacidiphilum kamchatkense]|uniref:site-specific DNA-methyltransferase (adenine-specific) n=1 Tax=Methylacidiphilum kamchatkense Kam1 TaxID=1202785 RepID=A0A516TJY6_9BACT|nr:site-specific DNA-methyltransferase [Methylacidiphilum kamchatkense]QDQ41484.1 adenine-specific DNA-methyltransferase [Methylacidiphilum kamchatkense Kam1]
MRDFRHTQARRTNNPPAGIAPTYEKPEHKTRRYTYDPHLDPQLQWAGKAEHTSFEVDVVPLHVHERISTKAILRAVRRPDPLQLEIFGETLLPADREIEFYRHEVGWANRFILGDSLLVMNSLLVKEGIAGKVQMIYVDPPYGIKYASNFQPRIDLRNVKDKDEDLTHEPEQIKAYRDTWKLGIHSYLTYLRDRLLLCRELLHESGSIFVQINDENLHLVRCLLDEVFDRENFVAVIAFVKTSGKGSATLDTVNDFLLWYAKNRSQLKYRQLYLEKELGEEGTKGYQHVELPDGARRRLIASDLAEPKDTPQGLRVFKAGDMTSQGAVATTFEYLFEGVSFHCGKNNNWKTGWEGMERLRQSERLFVVGKTLSYVRFLDEIPIRQLTNIWVDTGIAVYGDPKVYAVQTNTKVVERCILMTTDPGDLVFDPTCGSGTTAYCAEKWGRRWITCDTSRVALVIARQRLMTAKFDYYKLRDAERGPAGGFIYETVPHVTLESIAKNTEIDAIAAKYQPEIDRALAELNRLLARDWKEWKVPRELPHPVWPEAAREAYQQLLKVKHSDRLDAETQAEPLLKKVYRLTGHRWKSLGEVPEPMPPEDWSEEAKKALRRFWELKRAKRKEIDESIQRNAQQEPLYDRPKVVHSVVRVSGPFTVEAIPVPAVEYPAQAPIPQFETEEAQAHVSDRGGDYLTNMVNLLKQHGGVLFPGGKRLVLENIRPMNLGCLHAEAEAKQNGSTLRVVISFGPKDGPIIASQVQEAIPTARMNGYQILIFAGFAFDPEVQSLIQKAPVAGLRVHFANVSPDVLVGDLLKTTRASQIFTVFGQPDVRLQEQKNDTCVVELRGMDIYDPLTGEVHSTRGEDVAAWFLDTDYDGKTFHICQAFFPGDPDAWEKLQRALKAQIDPEAFERMQGTISFPFRPGEHRRIAVKVIDFRGNEVVRVMLLV